MNILKNICIIIGVFGFIIALGTAGTSDMELQTGQILMTDEVFYTRFVVSLVMLVGGSIGVGWCNFIEHKSGTQRLKWYAEQATAHN